jgi:hypothetical protein
MKYGIIVCPKCKQVKAVNLSCKTTRCIRCNKTLVIKKLRIFFKTDSESELRKEIGCINRDISEGGL